MILSSTEAVVAQPLIRVRRYTMDRKVARLLFLGVCIILAVLLITKLISPIVSGCVFAVALVCFGLLSRGFKKG